MTEYVHKYPFGAIESEEPILLGLLGQTLYGVHGLGSSSYLTVMSNVRNLHTNGSGFRAIEYDVHSSYSMGAAHKSSSCLGDFNIGHHHNDHYLFHNRADAEAYLAWARENTGEIRSDPWWDDYDTWTEYDYDYGDEA